MQSKPGPHRSQGFAGAVSVEGIVSGGEPVSNGTVGGPLSIIVVESTGEALSLIVSEKGMLLIESASAVRLCVGSPPQHKTRHAPVNSIHFDML